MANEEPDTHSFPRDVYHQASSDLMALKSVLPHEAVVSLAREVITRLGQSVADKSSRSQVIDDLVTALLSEDPQAAAALIEAQFQAGVTYDALHLGYLGPAARQLGEKWTSDEISFSQVTVGTGRIYGIMRSLCRQVVRKGIPKQRSALVACVPGETHVLGVRMATDLLREQGWTIDLHMALDHDGLVAEIIQSGHHIIGLSAGGQHALPALARLVLAIRVSRPDAAILVSGNIVREARTEISFMGVDGVSETFAEASAILDALWDKSKAP